MTHVSHKARAWQLAARWAEQCAVGDFDVEPDVREHILNHVTPSMLRKSEIIERNARKVRHK